MLPKTLCPSKMVRNVGVKESGNVLKQYQIIVAVTSVCPPLPRLCKDTFPQPSESI